MAPLSFLAVLFRPRMFAAMIIIAIISLTIHIVMLQFFNIPYPNMQGVGRVGLLLVALRVLALVMVVRLWRPVLEKSPLVAEIGVLALLSLTIGGDIRSAIMGIVTTTSFAFELIELASKVVNNLVLAAMIVSSARRLQSYAALATASVVITATMMFLVSPAIGSLVAPYSHLAQPEVYTQPYGPYVLGWSYPTFLETVFAVLAIAVLAGPRLSSHSFVSLLQFVALILLLRGTLILQVLFPWFMKAGPGLAALSISQFFLQDLAMAVLVWVVSISQLTKDRAAN